MAKVVDRHPTAINADLARRQRGKRLSAAGEGVGKPQGHSCSETVSEATASLQGLFATIQSVSARYTSTHSVMNQVIGSCVMFRLLLDARSFPLGQSCN